MLRGRMPNTPIVVCRENVTTWWCEVFGGPAGSTERLGGYPAMLAHHRDLGISADQRFRFASLMSLAADDADLPSDPEFRAALVGYLEWGTRLAMYNSQPGTDVVEQAPAPRWGWGVAPPYQPWNPDAENAAGRSWPRRPRPGGRGLEGHGRAGPPRPDHR